MALLRMNSLRGATNIPWIALCAVGFSSWAIWSCAEHWQNNPNYSYGWAVPPLVFGFGLRRAMLARSEIRVTAATFSTPVLIMSAIAAAAVIFLLEFARVQMWHPEIVLWTICLLAVGFSLAAFWFCGGSELARTELFPVCFFLTAVPWPPRFEQPIASALIQWVAAATVEILHWIGVSAQTAGGAIALPTGLVGITEACSGIRSLQAGIMFGLAMGEWFLLRASRRIALLFMSILFALATNLARTLLLSIQAARHGVNSVEQVHDLIGNIMVTALIVGIWFVGKLLAARPSLLSATNFAERSRSFWKTLTATPQPAFRSIFFACLAALISARTVYAWIEKQDRTQTAPFFTARAEASNGNQLIKIPRDIWNELRPTSGEYVRRKNVDLPGGVADCFHFFWKPSAWNRFALVHQPNICMPGVGWKSVGPPEPLNVDLNGESLQFYAFHFRRGHNFALELWGVWRNGEPVSLDYNTTQVFGVAPAPASMRLEGKRRSATEIIACSLIGEGSEPSREIAVAVLRSAFEYKSK
ncbi:MAG TPA: hypothetical protein DCO65_09250 [Spartobacteria bacterium]|jgi:exosortase|nr:hypothetical protein [Spartobacteria bacterium]